MLFAIKIPSLGITAAVEITHPARPEEPQHQRTDVVHSRGQSVNSPVTLCDSSELELTEPSQPRGVSEATTIPAASSFEERQLARVMRREQTISQASQAVEAHREKLSKTQLRSMEARVAALTAELSDDTCRRYPTARAHVQLQLDSALATIRGAL